MVPVAGNTQSMRCPDCRQLGTFEPVGTDLQYIDKDNQQYRCGQRLCPNPNCRAQIFILRRIGGSPLLLTYPPERIDFDASNVPKRIQDTLVESITCHANECYIAAAIMVRKTLEELCEDRGATGGNLKDRIRNLGTKILVPQELMDGLDDLRLLGNDAVHIESQVFDTVGRDEVELGIQFTKEVLKAVFQYSDLLAKLRALRKTDATANPPSGPST